MAGGNIKGITVEIGGDTSKLSTALKNSEKESRSLQKELKQVNTALKFNPDNVELLTQKQKLLASQIETTKTKLDALKQAEEQVAAQFKAGEIGEDQFRAFQREIIETESKLKTYEAALEETTHKTTALEELTNTMSDQEREVARLKDEYKNAVLMYGKNSEEAEKLADEIRELSGDLAENKTKMSDLDKAADDLDQSLDKVDDSAQKAGEGFSVLKGALSILAADLIRKAVDGLVDLAKETINVGMSFESSMSNNAALFKASGSELEKLTETAKHYGETTQFSASEAADALGYMALAGWDVEKATSELGGVLDLAAASGMGLAEASDMVTDYLSAFSNSEMTAAEFADKLAYAQANSNTTAQQLGEAYKNSAANLNAAGQDVETVTSLLAAMANQGLKGSEAGTALSAVMRDITHNMEDGAIQIGDTAVAVQDANGNYRDLTDILRDVEKATDGMGDAERAAALSTSFTADSTKGLNLILNDGIDKAADFEESLRNCDGAAKDMADTMNDNVAGSLKLLKSNIESKMINVFDAAKGSIRSSIDSINAGLNSLDWDKISEKVGEFAGSIADLFNYLVNHSEEVIATLKLIAGALGAVYAIDKAGKLIESLKLLKGAFSGLWGILQANPVTLVIGGLGLLAAALVTLKEKSDEVIEKEYGLTDAQELNVAAADRLKTAYDQLADARDKAVDSVTTEYGYLDELKEEYNGLIDSNGKVKEGYEDRANFIINTLAEALGVERDEILKNVDANGQLSKSIDDLILKKQAEATLSATESAYTEAIQKRNEALNTYVEAQKTYSDAEAKYQKVLNESGDVLGTYLGMLETSPSTADKFYWSNQEIIKGQQEAKDALEKSKTALDNAETAYVGYSTTIQNYEGLSAAIISGDSEKIAVALTNTQNNFITAETGTKESLERQVENLTANYELMKQAVEQGTPGVTEAQVKAAKDMVDQAKAELDKLPKEAEEAAKKTGDAHAEGLKKGGKKSRDAASKIASSTDEGLNSGDSGKVGSTKGSNYVTGMASTTAAANTTATAISKTTNTGLGSANTQQTGKQQGTKFGTGVSSTASTALAAGRTIGNSANSGAKSVNLQGAGSSSGGQYAGGVRSKAGDAHNAGHSLGSNAYSGAGSVSGYEPGANFGQGFINGIASKIGGAISRAAELARSALSAVQSTIKQGSPSKITTESGGFFGQGFINGIRNKIKDAARAARDMGAAAISALNETNVSEELVGSSGLPINGATFDRQLNGTFSTNTKGSDMSALIDRIDALESAIRNMRSVIVLDSGTLVGETINRIDSGLGDVYRLKKRGI